MSLSPTLGLSCSLGTEGSLRGCVQLLGHETDHYCQDEGVELYLRSPSIYLFSMALITHRDFTIYV
jgi:hypothetical protein